MSRSAAILAASTILLLTACATPTLRVEVEHISHPLAGWPFGPADQEAQLTQLNALLHWQRGGWYADAGIGWKVAETNRWDFVGPKLTATVRVGREFGFVKP